MIQLNENIEIIGVESTTKCCVLLALKGIDQNAKEATCLAVTVSGGVAMPDYKIDLISRAATFDAYDFISENEKTSYLLLFKRMLNDKNTKTINDLLAPNQ